MILLKNVLFRQKLFRNLDLSGSPLWYIVVVKCVCPACFVVSLVLGVGVIVDKGPWRCVGVCWCVFVEGLGGRMCVTCGNGPNILFCEQINFPLNIIL